MSRLREEYVETGKVKYVYKHFAILGPESNRGAEASECAAEQDAFWPYHDQVFADQNENHSSLNQEKLVSIAADIGLDTSAFTDCLSSGRYSLQISRESQTVQSLGLRGTPGFLINGLFINGAQPFEVFQQIIDEQLAAAESK
ncbi:MAG: thioredoxin domain-containing protein [Anaerolineae bacterium]|nr:thioredoxin domain-containing protein [Anaerolineae bacterium]MCB0177690.1 thioredoxin domain-containing protein [Anaerolineae bacterium]MCB0222542.1 thioredoxin domain-containing protein [Anaerolineae bacterium]MCB9103350.1 thioredoxin domain-containing protein [Anaerolineales bacterium]